MTIQFGSKLGRALFLANILTISISCYAQENIAYGIAIDAPLSLSECPRMESAGMVIYKSSKEPCLQNLFPKAGVPLNLDSGLTVVFPVGQTPYGSSWNQVGLVVLEGRVAALTISTTGATSQNQLFESLVAKYGPPNTKQSISLQNAYGAKVESIVAEWDKGENLQVNFFGIIGRADSGQLLIGTRAGLAERQARIDRALKGGTRPL